MNKTIVGVYIIQPVHLFKELILWLILKASKAKIWSPEISFILKISIVQDLLLFYIPYTGLLARAESGPFRDRDPMYNKDCLIINLPIFRTFRTYLKASNLLETKYMRN